MSLSDLAQGGSLFAYAPLVILFPVLGLLINMSLGRRLGERFVGTLASLAVAASFGVAILEFVALQGNLEGETVLLTDWIALGGVSIPWALKIDTLSVTMMLMVTGVSTLIHVYAIGYMHTDVRHQGEPARYTRFFVYFNLFVAAMMILVTANNYVMMFVGWEGVGLCSYLLIGFWFEKGKDGIGNAVAGKKAFVVNRVGDFGFMLAIFLVFTTFGTLQFDEVFHKAELSGPALQGVITAITLFLLLGAAGKSAQLPLFVWLPDAMAGPTPVSALIHAATMVTAGIYMIARNHVLFGLAPFSANLVAIVGAVTALFSATIAVAQFDIKKVLAYSTISQLGYMIAAVGMGAYVAGMFHLLTHAFFKALLFLSAGSVIQGIEHGHQHAAHHGSGGHTQEFDPQDMRNMGGLRSRMKVTFWVYLIAALAISGIPPLAGFFSKDEILTDAMQSHFGIYLLLAVAAFLTAFYMFRQILMVFGGDPRTEAAAQAKENPPVMTVPLMGLAALAILGGGLNLPGVHTLTDWLGHTLEHVHPTPFEITISGLSTAVALVAIGIAWRLYGKRTGAEGGEAEPLRRLLGPVFVGMERKWWVDELYDLVIVRPYRGLANSLVLPEGQPEAGNEIWERWVHRGLIGGGYQLLSSFLSSAVDLKIIDDLANNLGRSIQALGIRLRQTQTGYVRNYAFVVFAGAVVILGYMILQFR
ncbi:MAG TPA: NADH-quinone oxidoreductase subunit L [Anaerolineales bacterium]|nr:NADH-quinone oxidoreductase subunit L [Anaerolineales bacterium]